MTHHVRGPFLLAHERRAARKAWRRATETGLRFGLGRLPAEDERDALYPAEVVLPDVPLERLARLAAVQPRQAAGETFRYWWPSGWWGNQGRWPWCVAFAWLHFLEDGPVTQPHAYVDPGYYYGECQRVDEWPGEDYDGTSVRAGAKIAQRLGFIDEYRWADDCATALKAVLTVAPVILGTWWTYPMFTPDREGIIRVGAKTGANMAGGHAYLLNGVNLDRGLARIKNSWGRSWGRRGHAWLPFEDLDWLIRADGEACLPLERRLVPSGG